MTKPKDPATTVYSGQVADIIASTPRDSDYKPEVEFRLAITNARAPTELDELEPEERRQLTGILGSPAELGRALADQEYCLETAHVVDDTGALRFRLYGWNYGVGYLMPALGLDIVAFGAQHDLEHWRLTQRDLFVAMDNAFSRAGHGFQQPLSFCWWRQECWDELDGTVPGTVGSEPYLRKQLGLNDN